MNSIQDLIADDSFAISFQSMGQYRAALLKALDTPAPATPPAPNAEEPEELENLPLSLKFLRQELLDFEEWPARSWGLGCLDRAATLIEQQQAELARLRSAPMVGEVGELVEWIHQQAVHGPDADEWRRTATLLNQLSAPAPAVVPVAVIVRWEFEVLDEHDQNVASGDASTLEEAAREGQHYLNQYQQDGPCTLELRRVEVLNPDAIPLPQGGEVPSD